MPELKSITSYRLPAFFLVSICGYLLIAYGLERSNFPALISLFAVLFLCYYWGIRWVYSYRTLRWAIGAAVLFRVVLIFALPSLSDDFYRFIWDGNLWANGINPFLHTPEFYMKNGLPEFLSADLFKNLNSQSYYSVYPPVNQFVFGISASLFGTYLLGNVAVMKIVIVAAEIGTLWVMKKLLDHLELSKKWMLIYALNPLVILELSGNLHFEGVMIFFLLSAYYLFLKDRPWLAVICFTLAVNTKLIPLILLPYLAFSLGWKRSAGLIAVLAAGTVVLHLSFINQAFIHNFSDSLTLYFQSFEFNASTYYLVRWLGFQIEGYNIIQTAAPRLAILSTVLIMVLSWMYRRASLKNLPFICVAIFGIYYLFSTTVHPWYVTTLLAFVPFAGLVFPVVWSAVIPLTYITYITPAYTENLWLVALEYIIVLATVGLDIYFRKQRPEVKNRRMYSFV